MDNIARHIGADSSILTRGIFRPGANKKTCRTDMPGNAIPDMSILFLHLSLSI